ncbi:hypothetical protein [Nocardia sp. SSK8]|uniref:hypothetical protein n=1 Tax=Nocardia sp. SSK8 TaxID=3120154 RepID=UPI00300AB026
MIAAERAAAHAVLVAFWRRQLTPLPTAAIDGFLAMNVPELPADAPPAHLLAYAELVATVSDPELSATMYDTLRHRSTPGVRDERRLLFDLADACVAAAPRVAAGHPPGPGPELDHYVGSHAAARGRRDTPAFRRALRADLAGADLRVRRYWDLTTTFTGDEVTSGAAQLWLVDALNSDGPDGDGETGSPASPSSSVRTQGTTSTMSPGSSQS